MIDFTSIRLGIRNILLAVPGLPDLRAWENVNFIPPEREDWIDETLIPTNEDKVASDTIRAIGVIQYDLYTLAGSGTNAIEKLADTIRDSFRPEKSIDEHTVVYKTERSNGNVGVKWYKLPIRLFWRSHSIG